MATIKKATAAKTTTARVKKAKAPKLERGEKSAMIRKLLDKGMAVSAVQHQLEADGIKVYYSEVYGIYAKDYATK